MHTMRLANRTYPSAPAAVEGLLAMQAENYAQTLWALASRTSDTSLDALQRLVDDGDILRTHVLRPTWHFVRPDDIVWLVELTAPRIRPLLAQLAQSLDVSESALEASAAVITEALSSESALTREDLAERLTAVGYDATGQRLGLALTHAELSTLICSGPMDGRRQTYALLAERAPGARRLERDEALAELVLRYFRGHGPATERDLSYWATLTVTDVRAGLRSVAGQLEQVEHDGRTYWFTEPPPKGTVFAPRGHLLLSLDEYHNGYQDSRYVLDADGIIPRGRRPNVGMALVDGQMVGDMRRTARGDTVTFEIGTFRSLSDDEVSALQDAAKRCAAFLGVDRARVELTRR
jgi:hypothetical protein